MPEVGLAMDIRAGRSSHNLLIQSHEDGESDPTTKYFLG
jgi:hypothetical protein